MLSGRHRRLAIAAFGLALDEEQLSAFANNDSRELAKNGVWSLFAAFRNNELDYDRFYPTLPVDEAFRLVRGELVEDGSVLSGGPGGRGTRSRSAG